MPFKKSCSIPFLQMFLIGIFIPCLSIDSSISAVSSSNFYENKREDENDAKRLKELVRIINSSSRNKSKIKEAIIELSKIGDSTSVMILTESLKKWEGGDVSIKQAILQALGQIGNPSAIPYIIDHLKNSSKLYLGRSTAIKAISNMGDDGIKVLYSELASEDSLYQREVIWMLCKVLPNFKNQPHLIEMLNSNNEIERNISLTIQKAMDSRLLQKKIRLLLLIVGIFQLMLVVLIIINKNRKKNMFNWLTKNIYILIQFGTLAILFVWGFLIGYYGISYPNTMIGLITALILMMVIGYIVLLSQIRFIFKFYKKEYTNSCDKCGKSSAPVEEFEFFFGKHLSTETKKNVLFNTTETKHKYNIVGSSIAKICRHCNSEIIFKAIFTYLFMAVCLIVSSFGVSFVISLEYILVSVAVILGLYSSSYGNPDSEAGSKIAISINEKRLRENGHDSFFTPQEYNKLRTDYA